MNKRLKVLDRTLISHNQSAEVLQPGVGSLNYPSALVPPQPAPVLMGSHFVVLPLGDDWLDLSLHQKRSRRVRVIPSIPYQPLRLMRTPPLASPSFHLNTVECSFKEFDFRRGSLLHAYSERSTLAICQYHKLCPLAAFGLTHTVAPFLAATNMPSTKHSFHLIFLSSFNWSRKARHKFKRTPLSAHSLNRRWTADFEPYFPGNSLQGAPAHKIQRMPSKHLRSSSGGRPPFRERLRLGKCCFMSSHCLSLTARQAIGYLHDLVTYSSAFACQPVLG